MVLNITWSNGDNTTWSNGDNAIWDLSGLFCAFSVALRNYNTLVCAVSVALRDWNATVCAQSKAQRTNYEAEVFDIYATEDTLSVETFLGNTAGTLTDIALADGTWRIEARPYKNQWKAVRCGQLLTVVISGGVIDSVISLPPIENLYSNPRNVFGTDIFWTWVDGFGITTPTTFGLWFDPSASIDTSGSPDASVIAKPSQTLTGYRRAQTVQEYVAVRAMDDASNKGPQAELLLPMPVDAPVSPAYEWGEREV